MKNTSLGLLFLAGLMFLSCNPQSKQRKEAELKLHAIENLIWENHLQEAAVLVDSVHFLYPNFIEVRTKASELKSKIDRMESERILAKIDSVMPKKQKLFDSIKNNFLFEKDSQYLTVGVYTHKSQLPENNTSRTFLKANVTENGELSLVSAYFGARPVNHDALRVIADNDISIETKQDNGAHYTKQVFEETNGKREVATFNQAAENGICKFISENSNIKVTLAGGTPYTYSLSVADKKAITDTYQLWLVVSDMVKMKAQQKRAQFILHNDSVK